MGFIADALSRKNEQLHQTDYNWRLVLPTIDKSGIVFADDRIAYNNASDEAVDLLENAVDNREIIHRVNSIDLPTKNFEQVKNSLGDESWHMAGKTSIGQISIVVDEMEDGLTEQYFVNWMRLIRNSDGTYNPPGVYHRTITHYKTAGSGIDLNANIYKGVFPLEIQPISWSYEGNSVLQYRVSLSVDSVLYTFIPANVLKARIVAQQKKFGFALAGVNLDILNSFESAPSNIFGAFGV
jgi:hypothetical protein